MGLKLKKRAVIGSGIISLFFSTALFASPQVGSLERVLGATEDDWGVGLFYGHEGKVDVSSYGIEIGRRSNIKSIGSEISIIGSFERFNKGDDKDELELTMGIAHPFVVNEYEDAIVPSVSVSFGKHLNWELETGIMFRNSVNLGGFAINPYIGYSIADIDDVNKKLHGWKGQLVFITETSVSASFTFGKNSGVINNNYAGFEIVMTF